AVNLLNRLVEELPESGLRRADLAQSLAGLADLLKVLGRGQEAEETSLRAIQHYEYAMVSFPHEPEYRRSLTLSYLQHVNLLWEIGRQTEANQLYHKALALHDPPDPVVHKELAWFLATNAEPHLRDAPLAVRLATKAVAARPESADYRNTLGVANY